MTTKSKMKPGRVNATIVGALFLLAMVTSLLGGVWLESIMDTPDYLVTVSANDTQVIIGVLLEIINCAAVVGIAVAIYPIFKTYNEALALGYIGFRVVEAVILIAAVISPLLLITLSQEYLSAQVSDTSYFQTLGTLYISERAQLTGLLTPIFFSLGALLFYYFLYQSKLVPRFISIWGFIAVVLLLTWNLLETFGVSISAGIIFGLPIILNEIFLGIWLIFKGYNLSVIAPENT